MGKPLKIGGLSQTQALEVLGLAKMTLWRYRNAPDWPGDDCDLATIAAHCAAKKGVQGRLPKTKQKPDSPRSRRKKREPDSPLRKRRKTQEGMEGDEDWQEYEDAMSLDEEMKRTMIEVKKVTIKEYQLKCMQEYRDALIAQINAVLDAAIESLADQIEPGMIELVRCTLRDAQRKITGAK